MGLFKNTTDILAECAKTENYTAPSTRSIEESISNLLEEFNETDNVFYTEEMGKRKSKGYNSHMGKQL